MLFVFALVLLAHTCAAQKNFEEPLLNAIQAYWPNGERLPDRLEKPLLALANLSAEFEEFSQKMSASASELGEKYPDFMGENGITITTDLRTTYNDFNKVYGHVDFARIAEILDDAIFQFTLFGHAAEKIDFQFARNIALVAKLNKNMVTVFKQIIGSGIRVGTEVLATAKATLEDESLSEEAKRQKVVDTAHALFKRYNFDALRIKLARLAKQLGLNGLP